MLLKPPPSGSWNSIISSVSNGCLFIAQIEILDIQQLFDNMFTFTQYMVPLFSWFW